MKNTTLAKWGALYALGVVVYVSLVALFMDNGSKWFGEADQSVITPIAILLLFVFSALVTSSLVLGKPILLYLDGKKKEELKQLLFTGLSIFGFMVIFFITLISLK